MTNYSTYQDDQPMEQQANWSGVFAMTLCIFALIACEFMPVSLLTPMAEDLSISKGMVGQGLAISGFFAVNDIAVKATWQIYWFFKTTG